MNIYFFIFLVILLSHALFIKKASKRRNEIKYCCFVGFLLILIGGLRGETVGIDTAQYKVLFNEFDVKHFTIFKLDYGIEWIFPSLMYVIKSLGLSYQVFIFVVDVILIVPTMFVIYEYSTNKYLAILTFYGLTLFPCLAFAAERQAMAFGMLMIGFHFMMQRKYLWYVVFVYLAFSCHMSSIIFAPCIIFMGMKMKKKYIFLLTIAGIAIAASAYTILSFMTRYARMGDLYMTSEQEAGGERYFIFLLLFALFALRFRKILANDETMKVSFYIYAIGLLLWPVCHFNPALYRLTYYFNFFLALFFPNLLRAIPNKGVRQIVTCCYIGAMLFSCAYTTQIEAYSPYMFFWE